MADLQRVRPTHALIDWGPTFAGVLVALALTALLGVLGVAIGATVFNPFDAARGDMDGLTIGGGLWTAFSALVSLEIGAFIATRASPLDDAHHGILQGAVVWALFVVACLIFAGLGASLGAVTLLRPEALVEAQLAAVNDPQAAEAMADATATLAWWAFLALALGLAGAVAGGMLGEDPPFWDVIHDRYHASRSASKRAAPISPLPPT